MLIHELLFNRLFCPLSKSELKYTKRTTLEPQHPPMFACITRKSGYSDKDLECHGFVCKSTEEAVSIAAQLYQSLVDTVKAQGNDKKVRIDTMISNKLPGHTGENPTENQPFDIIQKFFFDRNDP